MACTGVWQRWFRLPSHPSRPLAKYAVKPCKRTFKRVDGMASSSDGVRSLWFPHASHTMCARARQRAQVRRQTRARTHATHARNARTETTTRERERERARERASERERACYRPNRTNPTNRMTDRQTSTPIATWLTRHTWPSNMLRGAGRCDSANPSAAWCVYVCMCVHVSARA